MTVHRAPCVQYTVTVHRALPLRGNGANARSHSSSLHGDLQPGRCGVRGAEAATPDREGCRSRIGQLCSSRMTRLALSTLITAGTGMGTVKVCSRATLRATRAAFLSRVGPIPDAVFRVRHD